MKRTVKWCIEHEALKEFLTLNGSEVINMLLDEWDLDTALKVEREEGREEGREGDARNAIALGLSIDMVQKITGLDTKTIQELANNSR
jgi:predicted transposase YdaD